MLLQIALFERQAQASLFIYFPSDVPITSMLDSLASNKLGTVIPGIWRWRQAMEQMSSKPGCMRPYIKNCKYRAGEMAQLLRMCIVLPEVKSSVPNTHVRWLTIVCNSRPGKSNIFCGLHGDLHSQVHNHTQIHTNPCKIKTLET